MEKIYCGSGKKHAEYDIVNVSLCVSALPKEHIFEYKGKKYIKLKVTAKREPDQFGKTHYVEVDTYKPEGNTQQGNMGGEPVKVDKEDFGDLPF